MIIWTNAGLLFGLPGTDFNEILIKILLIQQFSHKKMYIYCIWKCLQNGGHLSWPNVAKWCHVATKIWVHIGLGKNILLPDGTKPNTCTSIDLSLRSNGIHLRAISQFFNLWWLRLAYLIMLIVAYSELPNTSCGTYTSVGWHIVRKLIMRRPEHNCRVAHCQKIYGQGKKIVQGKLFFQIQRLWPNR